MIRKRILLAMLCISAGCSLHPATIDTQPVQPAPDQKKRSPTVDTEFGTIQLIPDDRASVTLRIFDGDTTLGSAFALSLQGRLYIATAAHVVRGMAPGGLSLSCSNHHTAIDRYIIPERRTDLAFLLVRDENQIDSSCTVQLPSVNVDRHIPVFAYHYSVFHKVGMLKAVPIFSRGRLEYLQQENIVITMDAIKKGASGAPILYNHSNPMLLGMITSRAIDSGNASYLGVAKGVSYIKIVKTILRNQHQLGRHVDAHDNCPILPCSS